jgi:hypothetical protein
MSILSGLEGVEGVDTGGVDAVGVDPDGASDGHDDEEMEDFPFTWLLVAITDPKDFTLSDLTAGMAAGEVEIGAETSPIDPKVTAVASRRKSQLVIALHNNCGSHRHTNLVGGDRGWC